MYPLSTEPLEPSSAVFLSDVLYRARIVIELSEDPDAHADLVRELGELAAFVDAARFASGNVIFYGR